MTLSRAIARRRPSMKIYERGSSKRVFGLLAVLLILVAVYVSVSNRPQPVHIPALADPQTMYHTAWEVVAQNFYDQQKLDDWKSWEHKYDGKLSTEADAENAINEMLKSLDDPFTFLLGATSVEAETGQRRGSFVGIGITLAPKVVDGKPVLDASGKVLAATSDDGYPLVNGVIPGGPAARAGLKGGDRIVTVSAEKDGVLTPVDTRGMALEVLSNSIRGPQGTSVMLTIRRDGQTPFNVAMVRTAVSVPTVTYKMLDGNLGYIQISNFGADNMVPQLIEAVKALKEARGLIVDLRNNPGGQVN